MITDWRSSSSASQEIYKEQCGEYTHLHWGVEGEAIKTGAFLIAEHLHRQLGTTREF